MCRHDCICVYTYINQPLGWMAPRRLCCPQPLIKRSFRFPPPTHPPLLPLMCPTAEQGHRESQRRGVSPLDPSRPSDLSATPWTADIAEANGKDGFGGAEPRAWPEGKVFAGAGAAVWTETATGLRAEDGKVFAETGIMSGTGVWARVGTEWRPRDGEPGLPRNTAAWLEQQRLQTFGTGQKEQPDFSSVTTELQAPAMGKPLGLLSKAAWTRSSSYSASSRSSFTTKSAPLPPSTTTSSSSSPASSVESQTVASDDVSLVAVSNSSSYSNSNSSLGMFFIPALANQSDHQCSNRP